jgi:hypothetical protein
MYECISIIVKVANDSIDKIKMLAVCPLTTFAQALCCHVFERLTRTFWEGAYDDHVLLNFRWDS